MASIVAGGWDTIETCEPATSVIRYHPGCRPQDRGPGGLLRRREAEQMPRHALVSRVLAREPLGGSGVQRLPLERRDLLVDAATDHRMNEVEDRLHRQHSDLDESIGRRRGRSHVAGGQGGHFRKGSRGSEDGNRARDGRRRRRQAAQARRTARPTRSDPNSSTRSASAAAPRTPSAASSTSSSPRKNGLPPVARWHASPKTSATAGRCASTILWLATAARSAPR